MRQGIGQCTGLTNCMFLTYNIHDSSTNANIYSNWYGSSPMFPLLGVPDYINGSRIDSCMGGPNGGNMGYGLVTSITPGINLNITIPAGGGGSCSPGGGGPICNNNGTCDAGEDTVTCPIDCQIFLP